MFSDGDMSEVESTVANTAIYDDNNIIRGKHNPKNSMDEQPCDVGDTFKVEKAVEKVITVANLPSDMCPIREAVAATAKKDGSRYWRALTPKAVHAVVPTRETVRYSRLLAVSGSKQSAGMTFLTVPESGKSAVVRERAFPLSPEKAMPSRSINALGLSGSFCSFLLGPWLFPPPRLVSKSDTLGRLVAMLTRVLGLADLEAGAKAAAWLQAAAAARKAAIDVG